MPSPSELNKRILICARARETPNRPHGGQGGDGQLPNEVLEATSHPGVYLVPVPTSAMSAEAQRHHHSADDSGDARPVQLHLEFITLACQRSGDSSDTMNATNQESNGYRSDARGGVTRGTVLVTSRAAQSRGCANGAMDTCVLLLRSSDDFECQLSGQCSEQRTASHATLH